MKDGQTPIHIMRWAPADYENDPFVMLMKKRDNTRVLAFYGAFLNRSHMAGGSLPADLELLSASLQLSLRTTKAGLSACLAHGKVELCDGRVFHKRVVAGIEKELRFRELQREHGKEGGRPRKATLSGTESPPASVPAPFPAPAPAPVPRGFSASAATPASAPERALPVNGLTDPALTEYANGIWDEFVRRSGKADRVMSPLEWQHVTRWWGKGIALSTVLQALSEVKNRGDTLGYYAQAVETEHGRVGRALQR